MVIPLDSKLEVLTKVKLFSVLDLDELAQLQEKFSWVEFEPEENILGQDEKVIGIYILTEGKCEVLLKKDGHLEYMVNQIGSGEFIGELDLLAGKNSYATFRCVEKCKALYLEAGDFAQLLVCWPKLYQVMLSKLTDRLNQLNMGIWEVKHREFLRSGLQLNKLKAKYYPIWGSPKTTKEIEGQVELLAKIHEPLILIGEPGTGQQLFAWHIHKLQFGEDAPFLVIDGRQIDHTWGDLSFIPPHRIDDSPITRASGLLDLAEGGTLFIRDINLISPRAQVKLAKVMHYKKLNCRIIGSLVNEPDELNVRFNPELHEEFKSFYRFKPLRERKKDISYLVSGILESLALEHGREILSVNLEATKLLLTHHYRQGNVSELVKIIERAFFLAEGQSIGLEHLFFGPPADKSGGSIDLLKNPLVSRAIKKDIFPFWLQKMSFIGFWLITLTMLLSKQQKIQTLDLLIAWGIWWPILVISSGILGRIWCGICPISYTMELVQKVFQRNSPVPDWLKKYDYLIMTALFLLIIWIEAITRMRTHGFTTALLLITITTGATIFGILFTRHTWCRYLCPLGAFIGTAAIGSVVEVRANSDICLNKCTTHQCYRGDEGKQGCPMFQHAPFLDNNFPCKLCMRCINNCPHGAIKLNLRFPAREVWHLVRVDQGLVIFIGVILAILIPITYFEPYHTIWPQDIWNIWFSLSFWLTAFTAGGLTWFLVKPFKTKGASKKIKMAFALVPLVVAGYIAYQLHFAPGANSIFLGLGYKAASTSDSPALVYVSILRVGQLLAAIIGIILTTIAIAMVWLKSSKKH